MIDSEGGFLELNMPLQITPVKNESDSFMTTEPIFMQKLSTKKSIQVPKTLFKRGSIKASKNVLKIPENNLPPKVNRRLSRPLFGQRSMSKLPSLYEEPPESPRAKEKNKINVVGSLIYEEPATGDFSLNFYTAKFKQEDE